MVMITLGFGRRGFDPLADLGKRRLRREVFCFVLSV